MKSLDCRLSLLLGIAVTSVLCAETVIGVASTRGNMEVNHAAVRGNANIADGASIRTNDTVSRVNLVNGVQITLGQRTAASIHAGSLQLLEGGAQALARNGFGIEALGFRVAPETGEAVSSVAFENPRRILVSAARAPVQVSDRNGILLARVAPGTTYFFEPEADDQSAPPAGKKNSGPGASKRKAGLSTRAKWGTAAGIAAVGATVGLSRALSGDDSSR